MPGVLDRNLLFAPVFGLDFYGRMTFVHAMDDQLPFGLQLKQFVLVMLGRDVAFPIKDTVLCPFGRFV